MKGFVFSFEALISLLIFSLLLISFPLEQKKDFTELIVLQQENDLLKIWNNDFSEGEMKKDLAYLGKGVLYIDNKLIYGVEKDEEGVASESIMLDKSLEERKVRIIFYYN
jgi:hypothetical protein